MIHFFIAVFLVTLSIFIHELGHFLAARWRKLVVPRFSIFGIGNPIISRKWRGVEYCICWLPIGAYVMIPQLADLGELEGGNDETATPLPPADYTSKVLVAGAGPAANLLLALMLAVIVWVVGVQVPVEVSRPEIGDVTKELVTNEGKTVPGPAFAAGLQPGDIIREIDGKPVTNFQDIFNAILFGSQRTAEGRRVTAISVERKGVILQKQVFPELVSTEGLRAIGISPRTDLVVEKIKPNSPSAKAGLLPGDRIVSVDGKTLTRREELREHFQVKKTAPSSVTIQRGAQSLMVELQPQLEKIEGYEVYLIGVTWKIETELVHRIPFVQMGEAFQQIAQTLVSLLSPSSDIGVRHMSGLVGIVDNLQQAASYGLTALLSFLIMINVSLAVGNLLPIPVLDGGHIVIATLTKLRGRPFDTLMMQKIISVCFVMLLGLIAFVSFHDIRRATGNFFKTEPPATSSAPAKTDHPSQAPGTAKP